MSDYTIPTSNTVTTIDPQATKIRKLQSDVNELKELVEYLQDRIRKLKEAGDVMHDSCFKRSARLKWAEVKEVKP